jgi:hypothetical protein
VPKSSRDLAIDISIILLVVELLLLIPTLLLIILGTREERERKKLMEHITSTAKMLSRQEYFHSVETAMRSAKESIKGYITGSPPRTGEQEETVQRIVKIIEQVKSSSKQQQLSIQYLVPKAQDRLCVAFRYTQSGASVRFHPGLLVNDLRYVTVDKKTIVIGLPTTSGENQPTREGYSIPSVALAGILDREFDLSWGKSIDYEAYAGEIVREIKSHSPETSSNLLAEKLMISPEEVDRLLSLQAISHHSTKWSDSEP